SVGGTGKTPLAAWIASYCAAHGRTPGILLRGYGGDEPLVHRRLVPQAVVVANPDRVAGAGAARAQGAPVLAMEDACQPQGVGRFCEVRLVVSRLEGMRSGTRQELGVLAGRRVVAAAGIADPESFAQQLGTAGASVQLVAYQDHHAYRQADLERLVRAATGGDYVVVTEKDAVKLRRQWPGSAAEPLVAVLAVHWERNGRALEQAVDAVLASARRP